MTKGDLNKLKSVVDKYNLKTLILFGSYAKGTETENSDIDFAVLNEEAFDLATIISIEYELEKLLEKSVDLIDLNNKNLGKILIAEILNTGEILFCKDSKLYEQFYTEIEFWFKDNLDFISRRRSDLLSD